MFEIRKFSSLQKNTILYEGMIIKGYTYNIGDFRTKNDKWSGWPKLRVGVIVRKYSQNFIKVQFRNSAALDQKHQKISNVIPIYYQKTQKLLDTIRGTESYCMWLRRDSIKQFFKPITRIETGFDYETIYQKHSKNKKDVEKKYFNNNQIIGLKPEIIKKVLHEFQFTKTELFLDSTTANFKVKTLIQKHGSKDRTLYCVPYEYQKVLKAQQFCDFSEDQKLKQQYQEYIKTFQPNKCKIKPPRRVNNGKK